MIGNVNHHECVNFPHLDQRSQISGETGRLGSKLIRNFRGRFYTTSQSLGGANSVKLNNSLKTQERSVKIDNNQPTNGNHKISDFPPLPPRVRMGSLGF